MGGGRLGKKILEQKTVEKINEHRNAEKKIMEKSITCFVFLWHKYLKKNVTLNEI